MNPIFKTAQTAAARMPMGTGKAPPQRGTYAPNVASDPGHNTFVGGLLGQNRHHTNQGSFTMPGFEQTQGAYSEAIRQQQMNAGARGEKYYDPERTAAMGAGANDPWRGQQSALTGMLMQGAMGQGPSAAQAQLQAGTDANIRNAMAMGQSMPGGANMSAYRSILENQAMAQQQGVNQAAQLRAQEQQGAQAMLGNVLQGARGQDLNQFQANQQAGQGWAGLGQNMQQNASQAALGWGQLLNQNNAAQLAAQVDQQRIAAGAQGGASNNAAMLTGGVLSSLGAGLFNNTSARQGMAGGGMVPGYAKGGDASANDIVPAMLSPGEIVLPRSVVNDEDAEKRAAEFVRAIKAANAKKTRTTGGA